MSRRTVTVATYNIHGCVGLDGVRDPERVGRVLAELAADVVALQEVDSRGGRADPLAHLAGIAGHEAIVGPTLTDGTGHYGNVVLTRLPIERVERLDLSVDGREPRGAIVADLRLDDGRPLCVVATHLGLRHGERRRQIEALARRIDAHAPDTPIVLLGDLNTWRPVRHALGPMHDRLVAVRPRPSFPARRPILALDRVWVRPGHAIIESRVHRSATSAMASDHLPVVVRLRP